MIVISGLLLFFLFFSPFASCGSITVSGAELLEQRVNANSVLYDGSGNTPNILAFSPAIFPLVGLLGTLAGAFALAAIGNQRLAHAKQLGGLVVLLTIATIVPVFDGWRILDESNGFIDLEWGFYGSVLATIGLFVGGVGLAGLPEQDT